MYYYIDSKNTICSDNITGNLGWLQRSFYSAIKIRDYDLFHIFKKIVEENIPLNDDGSLESLICKKLQLPQNEINKLKSILISEDLTNNQKSIYSLAGELKIENKHSTFRKLQKVFANNRLAEKNLRTLERMGLMKKNLALLDLTEASLDDHSIADLKFLFETRVIYAILGLQNSTVLGSEAHQIKISNDGVQIKKMGKWTPVEELRQSLQWDPKTKLLSSRENLLERWTYLANGLQPVDHCYDHSVSQNPAYSAANGSLHPVAQLSTGEMEKLLSHARQFTGFNSDHHPDPLSLTGIIQIVTDPDPVFEGRLWTNWAIQQPVHASLRIILSDGTVYSTGMGKVHAENEFGTGWNRGIASVNGQPTNVDYTEFKRHNGRVVTSIPATEQTVQNILEKLNKNRKESIRFNIYRQNCVSLVNRVMSWSGVDVNVKVPLTTVLYRALPDIDALNRIGEWLRSLADSNAIKALDATTPNCVKSAFKFLYELIFFIPRTLGTLILNTILASLGGTKGSQNQKDKATTENPEFENFEVLVTNPLSSSALFAHHSAILINWQLQQQSTFIHQYGKQPSMGICPSSSPDAVKYSQSKKKELKRLLRHAKSVQTP